MTEPLFSYGTLMDSDIQSALFGRSVPCEKAVLHGWARYLSADGYIFIKPEKGDRVGGVLLYLSNHELGTADLWEEVPVYDRERVSVTLPDDDRQSVWAYTRRSADGSRYTGPPLGINSKDYILEEAHALKNI